MASSRAARAKATGNEARFDSALGRCLELFDLTLADDRWRGRRREIAMVRERIRRLAERIDRIGHWSDPGPCDLAHLA